MSTVTDATSTMNWGDIADLTKDKSAILPEGSENDRLANKEVFMQLLVAQLKNQNPLSPADGVEFISQLAQFTQLEQSLGMRQDISAIRDVLTSSASSSASSTGDAGDATTQP
jgi:flagellar basal-body rod modification protein FlgD